MNDLVLGLLQKEHTGIELHSEKKRAIEAILGYSLLHLEEMRQKKQPTFEVQKRALAITASLERALKRHSRELHGEHAKLGRMHFHSRLSGSIPKEVAIKKHAVEGIILQLQNQTETTAQLSRAIKTRNLASTKALYDLLLESEANESITAQRAGISLDEQAESIKRALATAANPFEPTHIP